MTASIEGSIAVKHSNDFPREPQGTLSTDQKMEDLATGQLVSDHQKLNNVKTPQEQAELSQLEAFIKDSIEMSTSPQGQFQTSAEPPAILEDVLSEVPEREAASVQDIQSNYHPMGSESSVVQETSKESEIEHESFAEDTQTPSTQLMSDLQEPTAPLASTHTTVADDVKSNQLNSNLDLKPEPNETALPQPKESFNGDFPKINGQHVDSKYKTKVVFLFTGQGAQWRGMGGSLLKASNESAFSTSIHLLSKKLNSLGCSWELVEALGQEEKFNIDTASVAIPLTIATQIALVDFLIDAGVKVDIVLGHSTGEIGAAYAAGLLSRDDAITIAYNLGTSLSESGCLNGAGKMLAIGLPAGNVHNCIGRLTSGQAEIGCINSPRNTTASGDSLAIDQLRSELEEAEVFCRELKVDAAYHSSHMNAIRLALGTKLKSSRQTRAAEVKFYSSVHASRILELEGSYWVDNITSSVQYSAALESILQDHIRDELLLVEIGPQPHLRRPTLELLERSKFESLSFEYYTTFKQGIDTGVSITELSRKLLNHGIDIKTVWAQPQHDVNGSTESQQATTTKGDKHNETRQTVLLSPFLKVDHSLFQIYEDLAKELGNLVSIPYHTVESSMSDCGLDSHLASQFRGLILRKYKVSISIQDILDSKSLILLALLILNGGTNVQKLQTQEPIPPVNISNEPGADGLFATLQLNGGSDVERNSILPKLPLPDLEDTLEAYYASVETFGNVEELAHTREVIKEFKKPEYGQKLQDRLLERVNDPELDCWLADLYNSSNFLDRNGPLVPFSSFFYTHKLSAVPHTQAERAAIITSAVTDYKELLDNGAIQPAELNGQPTCMHLFPYLFNTSRLPVVGSDVMERFPGNEHIIVLRKGKAFKVELYTDGIRVPYQELKDIFETILVMDNEGVDIGILTSDDRNVWAKVIEAAAFVICLDEATPVGAPQRAKHFHFGDGKNRWNDKSIQFVVCQNGVSGFVGDHSMLDAGTVLGLNNHVSKAILEFSRETTSTSRPAAVETLPLEATPHLLKEIKRMKEDFKRHTAGVAHAFTTYRECGATLPRNYRCPPKSYFQLVVVLASRYHFGYNPAFWETVSLGNFHKGRVEINQVIRPCIVEFCDVIDDPTVPITRKRELLYECVKTHTSSVMRAVRGRGVDRHITSLRQMIRVGEDVPAFFDDPVYARSRPRKIMSHCHETGMAEKGFLLRDPEAVWVHYEVEDDSVHFSVTSLQDVPETFCGLIDKAAEALRRLLVDT